MKDPDLTSAHGGDVDGRDDVDTSNCDGKAMIPRK